MGQFTAAATKAWHPAQLPWTGRDVASPLLLSSNPRAGEPGLAGVAWAWLALAVPFLGAWLQADAAAMGACVVAMAASPMVAAWWLDAPATVLHAVLGGVLLVATWLLHPLAGSLGIPLGLYSLLACLAVAHAVLRRGQTRQMERSAELLAQQQVLWERMAMMPAQPALVTSEDGATTLFMNAPCRALLRMGDGGVQEHWLAAAQRGALLAHSPLETEMVAHGGQRLPVRVVLLPLRWSGQPAWLWLMEDRRQVQQQTQELFKAQRLATVGQMVSGVAHELNNALTCVLNNVEYARASDADPKEVGQALADAEEAARHIQSMVGDLRVFGRLDEGPAQPVSVAPVLETSVRLCHATLKHTARVVTEYQPVPCVMGAPQTLTGIFVGLLLQASRVCSAAPGGPERVLTLRVRPMADKVGVEVVLPEGVLLRPAAEDPEAVGLGTVVAQLASLGGQLETRQTVDGWGWLVTLPVEGVVEGRAS